MGVGQPSDGLEKLLAVSQRDAEFLEVGVGQLAENFLVDIVLREDVRVATEAELLQPLRYLSHRHSHQRTSSPHSEGL